MTANVFNAWTTDFKVDATNIDMTTDVLNTWASSFNIDAENINFKTGNFEIKNANNVTTFKVDGNGNVAIGGLLTQNAYIDNMKATVPLLNYRAQYVTIPSGSVDSTGYITWDGGSTVILDGVHTDGNVFMRLPSQSSIRSTIGIASGNFVAEINIINLSGYEHLYICFNERNELNSLYPRRMSFDDTVYTGADSRLQLAKGDFMKIILVYNNNYYNGYTIINNN